MKKASSEATVQQQKAKKAWITPRLTARGSIQTVTRGTGIGVGDSDNFNTAPALS